MVIGQDDRPETADANNILDTRFRANLYRLRTSYQYTQGELAGKLGWNSSYISHLETGFRRASLERTLELAKAFNVDPSVFFLPVTGAAEYDYINVPLVKEESLRFPKQKYEGSEIIGNIPIAKSQLATGSDLSSLICFRAEGESKNIELAADHVIACIDRNQHPSKERLIISSEYYAVHYQHRIVMVTRIFLNFPTMVVWPVKGQTDTEKYSAAIHLYEFPDSIIGRVVWLSFAA